MKLLTLFSCLICLAGLCAEPAAPGPGSPTAEPKPMKYPDDLREFRKKALQHDGVFAPDIAFSVRTCPHCNNPYVCGTYPRLRRQPFDSLHEVQDVIKAALDKPPPRAMFSPKIGRMILRSCPICLEPENGARPEKVLFCHVIEENGDDVQIEYVVDELGVTPKQYWLVPHKPTQGGTLDYDQAIPKNPADESEASFRHEFGQHFSLRAVWNDFFQKHADDDAVTYENVSPGEWFIFRPRKVEAEKFHAFADDRLKPDREKGVFSRLEGVVLANPGANAIAGSYKEWARDYVEMLGDGQVECFVGVSFPELRRAAREVLLTRGIAVEVKEPKKKSDPGSVVLQKGDMRAEVELAPVSVRAALSALSLHQACGLFLAEPAFEIEAAEKLNQAIRNLYKGCKYQVIDGHMLVAIDRLGKQRNIDLMNLADKLDPEDKYSFDMFCATLLAWDNQMNKFGPEPSERDISPAGLPAIPERRVRPKGFLAATKMPQALFEPREDADGKSYELCYTSECPYSVLYVDPSTERFKGVTLEEAQKLYELNAGMLPTHVDAHDKLSFPGIETSSRFPCKAIIAYGRDIASLGADARRATQLATMLGLDDRDERIHFYALGANCVALAPRKMADDEVELLLSRARSMATENNSNGGLELMLHFDLKRGEPRGMIIVK